MEQKRQGRLVVELVFQPRFPGQAGDGFQSSVQGVGATDSEGSPPSKTDLPSQTVVLQDWAVLARLGWVPCSGRNVEQQALGLWRDSNTISRRIGNKKPLIHFEQRKYQIGMLESSLKELKKLGVCNVAFYV